MKTISVTDEQYGLLLSMAKLMKEQNNRITEHPLFCVYQKQEVLKPDGYGDSCVWVKDCEHYHQEDLQDCEPIKEYLEDHPEDKDMDPEDILENRLDFRRVEFSIEDIPVSGQVYFTEKEAKEHIERNSYHYRQPFVYVESAWRNPEMILLRTLLLNLKKGGNL